MSNATNDAVEAQILVTQVKSAIGTKPKHRANLRALGLRGIGQQNVLPDRPEIRGMLHRVTHLVSVEAVADPGVRQGAHRRHVRATDEAGS
jgi:large subunit ribosomal protein L30